MFKKELHLHMHKVKIKFIDFQLILIKFMI